MNCVEQMLNRLAADIRDTAKVDVVYDDLVQLRAAGISAATVLSLLQELRVRFENTPTEDRILETMDYVAGYCSTQNRIWPEPPTQG